MTQLSAGAGWMANGGWAKWGGIGILHGHQDRERDSKPDRRRGIPWRPSARRA